ncbi:hypothetical protein PFICI_13012 [Pestalotiopsis fici W106-1]|uniref:Cytochrome b561 domain-containing protein n=1 Tax=Pestalotiopsis fici (strain W106-1 / CGMCC3.15140) TaxID=1229662 RepID=W3WQD8_PESFW|nr:uncharacterized protein PFICI_13012 [Pestalotiopsis fici W106-1]ETS76068.1 hypothetical protein PFICI_13012 [Pestalotiopsis fici W106-1]
MAPTDALSAPGAVSYSSDNLVVGDGTWDFTKNDFLLPNLMGLPFETMQYNGMGNRFSTLAQYHQLITGHGVLAAIVFLLIIPVAVMMARFHRGAPGSAVKYHAYLQILAVGLTTVVFILGFFAVGPKRSLTNPHHGIGVAIYTLILVQALGGRFIRRITKRSLRVMIHQWTGRAIALLGIAQVPLGLTLYGSPKFTFILFAIWMAFLLLVYFVLSWRREKHLDDVYIHGGRSAHGGTEISVSSRREEHRGRGWLGPLAAGAGLATLWKGRKNEKERERSRSRSHSRSRSRVRNGSRPPEVISSRRESHIYSEKPDHSEYTDVPKRNGFMDRFLALAGLLGAGAFAKRQLDKRDATRRYHDEEYSAVATDTPSRRSRPNRYARSRYTESDITDSLTDLGRDERSRRHSTHLPGPGNRMANDPRTHRPTDSRIDSFFSSDYSSYVSPSRRAKDEREQIGTGKGILAGLGLGWLAAKMKGKKGKGEVEEQRKYEEERRGGYHGSRLTGDGYGSPRRASYRRQSRPAGTMTTMTGDSDYSSVEPRPTGTSSAGPPMPPLGPAGHGPVPVRPIAGESATRHDSIIAPVEMPPIPDDAHGHGILHRSDSGSESYMSAGGRPQRRGSSRRRRAGESAAAAAAASASVLAAETEADRRRRDQSHSRAPSQPVSVKVKYHDDRDRNITLRRLTEEEAAREQRRRRRRSNSASSLSESDIGGSTGRRRYRRDSSARRTGDELGGEPLSPPAPAFAGGRRPAKDAAYYAGHGAGTSAAPMTPMHGAPTVSSIDTPPGTHDTFSAMSPSPSGAAGTDMGTASAADRRRRRRLERRDQRPSATVEFT